MKASLLVALALVVLTLVARPQQRVDAQTPTNVCTLFPAGFSNRLPPPASQWQAPDGTMATGCNGLQGCTTSPNCNTQIWLIKTPDAARLYSVQETTAVGVNNRRIIAGLGTAGFYSSNPVPNASLHRGGYFVTVYGNAEAFVIDTARTIDANIQRALAPPPTTVPAAPAAPVPAAPPAVAPAQAPVGPTSEPLSAGRAEDLLRDALVGVDNLGVSIREADKNIDAAIADQRKADTAWRDIVGASERAGKANLMSFPAFLGGLTRNGQPLFPSFKSRNMQQVLALLSMKAYHDPDAQLTASRLIALMMRYDLDAAGIKR